MTYDVLVIGAGLAGATLAERFATVSKASVLVVDRRDHIAGNTRDDATLGGARYHAYGPHVFHTNAAHVVRYLSQFTSWRPYEHRVLSNVGGQLLPVPINRTTINRHFGLALDEAGVAAFLAARAEPYARIDDSEAAIRSKVGRELYETFFRGYTRKQWGRDPSLLDASVCGRIPTRTNDDDRYFTDAFQAMPAGGYSAMVGRMLSRPGIDVALGVDARDARDVRARHVVYTGPIDEYYDHRFGPLPYRSLRFEFEAASVAVAQVAACINEPAEHVPHTRTTDHGYLVADGSGRTVVSREYPSETGDPYYPIPCTESRERYARYAALAEAEPGVTFVGRLAEYRYFNMDQVVASALAKFDAFDRKVA